MKGKTKILKNVFIYLNTSSAYTMSQYATSNTSFAKLILLDTYATKHYIKTQIILIGSRQWSIRGQTHDWRHRQELFPFCALKWGGSFENLNNNIFNDWARDQAQNSFAEALNKYEKQEEKWKSRFLFREWLRNKYSSSLSRQSSERKASTKLIFKSLY